MITAQTVANRLKESKTGSSDAEYKERYNRKRLILEQDLTHLIEHEVYMKYPMDYHTYNTYLELIESIVNRYNVPEDLVCLSVILDDEFLKIIVKDNPLHQTRWQRFYTSLKDDEVEYFLCFVGIPVLAFIIFVLN